MSELPWFVEIVVIGLIALVVSALFFAVIRLFFAVISFVSYRWSSGMRRRRRARRAELRGDDTTPEQEPGQ